MLQLKDTPGFARDNLVMTYAKYKQVGQHRDAHGFLTPVLVPTDLVLAQSQARFQLPVHHLNGMITNDKFHTPSNVVVAHWTSDVESTAPLGVLLRHNLWIPFWCLISCKIRSIISVICDFTTKSDGIWEKSVVSIGDTGGLPTGE